MKETKSKVLPLAGLVITGLMGVSALAGASVIECDESCQRSISFQDKLDTKSMSIELLRKELELARIADEINSLSSTGKGEEQDEAVIEFLKNEIMDLRSDLNNRAMENGASTTDVLPDLSSVVMDTKGIENVYVTGTSSVSGEWSSRIFHNNSIQVLYLGEDVFPGATITNIDRRGVVISFDGGEYHKTITPSEVAQARAFNNIREERQRERDLINRHNSVDSGYQMMPGF